MKIGFDLDNTIINYNTAFFQVAMEMGFIGDPSLNTKAKIKSYLRKDKKDGEIKWQTLQGKVYGAKINYASLFPGVLRFLIRCRYLNYEVNIISHKTEFGHYDLERVPLRDAAKNLLINQGIEEGQSKLVKKIFFCDSKKDKIELINQNRFDFFVDDLPEILETLTLKTNQKILFVGSYESADQKYNADFKVCRNFNDVEKMILGFPSNQEIEKLLKDLSFNDVVEVKRIKGKGNSTLFCFNDLTDTRRILKVYSNDFQHDRLKSEYFGLKKLRESGFQDVMEPVTFDKSFNCGVYKWIDAENPLIPTPELILSMVDFIGRLAAYSQKSRFDEFQKASSACLSVNDVLDQINFRIFQFEQEFISNLYFHDYFENDLKPLYFELRDWVEFNINSGNLKSEFAISSLILSPSDFGIHNVLVDDKKTNYIDFEYFGWDDPAKLISDVAVHPGMNLTEDLKLLWVQNVIQIFEPEIHERYNVLKFLYEYIWCLIYLNEFRAEIWERRVNADPSKFDQKLEILHNQLLKSKNLYQKIYSEFELYKVG